MAKQQQHHKQIKGAPEDGGNLVPILIMLATVLVIAIPMIWLNVANPVNQYNAHLQKAQATYAEAQRSAAAEGASVDPMQAAAAYREFAKALRCGERAFGRNDQRLEDVLLAMLIFSVDSKQWPEAKRQGERLLAMQRAKYREKDQHFIPTYGYLTQVYRELGDSAAEERTLQGLVAIDTGVAARRLLAQFYLRQSRYAEALPLYRQVVAGDMIEVAKAEKAKAQAKYVKDLETTAADADGYLKTLSALKQTNEYRTVSNSRELILRKLKEMQKSMK